MPVWGIVIMYVFVFLLFAILHFFSKNKKPFERAFLSMVSGVLVLLAVNICAVFTKVSLPISLLSLTVSAFGGIPGVTLLLALNMIV